MAEVERYQALAREKELLNQKWDEQNATLVEAHEKVVQARLSALAAFAHMHGTTRMCDYTLQCFA